jgi:hypothetical protein
LCWDVAKFETSTFNPLLAEYRKFVLDPARPLPDGVVRASGSAFAKSIKLAGTQITITYSGAGLDAGHKVANEFSLDFYSMLMEGKRQTVDRPGAVSVPGPGNRSGLTAVVTPGANCQFSYDTRQNPMNLRLHRAFSDCIEVESIGPGGFAYTVDFAWPP